MSRPATRYIFRFIHVRSADSWCVFDTLSGKTFGRYFSEDDAVAAAIEETCRHSEYRLETKEILQIPLD